MTSAALRTSTRKKKIAALLLQMHRQLSNSPRAERLPTGMARRGGPGAAHGGRRAHTLDDGMREPLARRGGDIGNRAVVADALATRKLAHLCLGTANAVGIFTPTARPDARRMRAVYYGLCAARRSRPDFEARAALLPKP
jgi:hypothetical protein